MVENLTDARTEFHENTSRKLDSLVDLLERTVSEIPPTVSASGSSSSKGAVRRDEDSDDTDDPTELFHRDIGVQTSLPPSPRPGEHGGSGGTDSSSEAPTAKHVRTIGDLVSSLRGIKNACTSQTEDIVRVKEKVDGLKDDLTQMTLAGNDTDFVGSYSLYGSYGSYGGRRPEPDDEIKKARDNIRRVKGVMLSTRTFPLSTR